MSYANTKRRKLIKRLKRKYRRNWRHEFRTKVAADVKAREGEGIPLSDLIGL